MIIEKIRETLSDKKSISGNPILRQYVCSITYDGGSTTKGITYAFDEEDAILKNFRVLEQQGVDEIVVDISCEEYFEDL